MKQKEEKSVILDIHEYYKKYKEYFKTLNSISRHFQKYYLDSTKNATENIYTRNKFTH